jgi:hypothetical protein
MAAEIIPKNVSRAKFDVAVISNPIFMRPLAELSLESGGNCPFTIAQSKRVVADRQRSIDNFVTIRR